MARIRCVKIGFLLGIMKLKSLLQLISSKNPSALASLESYTRKSLILHNYTKINTKHAVKYIVYVFIRILKCLRHCDLPLSVHLSIFWATPARSIMQRIS